MRRVLFAVFTAGLALGFAIVAIQHQSLFRRSRVVEQEIKAAEDGEKILQLTEQESLRDLQNRLVYPYSVVPGGVRDAKELKWAAEHDPVVAQHYAGFDYDHARVVRLVLARTAFISYRIGNKVYWTRHRISLKKGETVITDGKITARTRCGNRVEEVPQQATSSSEPPAAKFEEPVHPSTGTAIASPPGPFESALVNRPINPGLGPSPPLSLVDPFGSGTWVPISPPPLPGVCGPAKTKNGKEGTPSPEASTGTTGKKGKGNPCGNGGAEVPEPSTWLLFASGLAAIGWMSRHRFSRT